jgi:hypothetical protein
MLRKELGPAVCDSVTNALKEIQTYNATRRYIVEVPWNYTTNKEATMKDILLQLQDIIIEKDKKPPLKRKTNLKSKIADTRWSCTSSSILPYILTIVTIGICDNVAPPSNFQFSMFVHVF